MKPQSPSGTATKPDYPKPNLGELYKPVGIQAVTAAAICKGGIAKPRPGVK